MLKNKPELGLHFCKTIVFGVVATRNEKPTATDDGLTSAAAAATTATSSGRGSGYFNCQLSPISAGSLEDAVDKIYDPDWSICRLDLELEASSKCMAGLLRNPLEDGE